MSLAGPSRSTWPAACSGLMNAGVPTREPAMVSDDLPSEGGISGRSRSVSRISLGGPAPGSSTAEASSVKRRRRRPDRAPSRTDPAQVDSF